MSQTISAFTLTAIVFAASNIPAIVSAQKSEPHTDKTVAEIRKVIATQQEAWNRGDIDAFMNGYARARRQSGSNSTVFVSEDSVTRGWETVRDRYKKKYIDRAKMGTLAFSELEITPLGPDAAVALGRWKLKRAKDEPHGRFTLIFVAPLMAGASCTTIRARLRRRSSDWLQELHCYNM